MKLERGLYCQDAGLKANSAPAPSGTEPAQVDANQSLVTQLENSLHEMQSRAERSESKCLELTKEHQENDAALQKLRSELAEARSQTTRQTSRIQYMVDKEKLLQGHLKSLKNQLDLLEQKNRIYADTVAKHEQSIAVLRGTIE